MFFEVPDEENWTFCRSKHVAGAVFVIAKLANKPHNHGDVKFFHAYTSLKLSNDTPVCRATNLCPWCDPPVTVLTPNFLGNPEIPKKRTLPPPRTCQNGSFGVVSRGGVRRCGVRCATENARRRGNCRTSMPQMFHLDCRVPKTFTFLAVPVAYPTELVLL